MARLKRGNIIFNETAETNDLHGVGSNDLLLMIAQGYIEEDPGEENNDQNSSGSAGEELKMEVSLAKEPIHHPPADGKLPLFWQGIIFRHLRLAHYNY